MLTHPSKRSRLKATMPRASPFQTCFDRSFRNDFSIVASLYYEYQNFPWKLKYVSIIRRFFGYCMESPWIESEKVLEETLSKSEKYDFVRIINMVITRSPYRDELIKSIMQELKLELVEAHWIVYLLLRLNFLRIDQHFGNISSTMRTLPFTLACIDKQILQLESRSIQFELEQK